MVAGILGPATASFLMGYNVWLPWVLGNALVFVAVLLTLLLPNRKDEPDPQDDLNDDCEIMLRENSNMAAMHKGISMKERVVAALQNLKSTWSLLAANMQVLLLLAMAGLSNFGNESLAILLLIYVPERYHWTFAKVTSLQLINSSYPYLLTPSSPLGWLPMVAWCRCSTVSPHHYFTICRSFASEALETLFS